MFETKTDRTRQAALPRRSSADQCNDLAVRLDREADHQLHLGFHTAAERLSHRAAELRGARL